ncbi:MAG: AAA family ATPase [Candidatus Hodarchaeota archaeon]
MKLIKFRISNYKSIEDSGEVDINDFTVLVGKNESGKTNILKALHKFNNVTEERYSKLRDYPRTRYHEYNDNDQVVDATFKLSDEEKQVLSEKCEINHVDSIRFNRKYNYALDLALMTEDNDQVMVIPGRKLIEAVNDFKATIDTLSFPLMQDQTEEQFAAAKKELMVNTEKIIEEIEEDRDLFIIVTEIDLQSRIKALESILKKYANLETGKLLNSKFITIKRIQETLDEVRRYILDNIPIFIYFETYALLDSRIHLPDFYRRLTSSRMSPTDKTANTMFELTKLDIARVVELGKIMSPEFSGNPQQYQQQLAEYISKNPKKIREASDERAILVDRASLSLSTLLREIWTQRENRPSFDVDGDFLRLWVTDEVTNAKIELEERSKGFQWFFSFFIVFMVESELGHKNAILLLDEPGLNLHASAQNDLIHVLQELSQKNQLIYTSHSPFMIDTDNLNSIRIVTIDENQGSLISNKIWPTDVDAIFPLQSALGYSASQSMFLGKNILIVEGMTDFWILSSLSNYLRDNGRIGLDDDLIITPAGGAQKITYLTSMMVSQKLKVSILADYDGAGKKLFDELIKTKILKEKHLVFVNECIGSSQEMTIEDIFPEDYYLRFVISAYSKELQGNQITSLTSQHPMITKRVEEELQKHSLKFHKTRPTRLILEEFSKPGISVPSEIQDRFESLFKIINKRRPK